MELQRELEREQRIAEASLPDIQQVSKEIRQSRRPPRPAGRKAARRTT
jgi:electron transfer flavoprotein alpha/beta subunit